jgi:hypothetical protein
MEKWAQKVLTIMICVYDDSSKVRP